eukprot:CAMPEP_0197077000 /NCGR_PEP_ID=MMETSP1384-20130603/212400_1 /TAXON_ID=29189 /ORGANISM="Ammonia sp." /LENGTH=418 /DNA_ID=CAMNT_0042515859 /DNA_START=46 /DNA_END=1302 /DNA_ORIENTATION=+
MPQGKKNTKKRKLREIKNSPIDLNVHVSPGLHFKNWRPFATEKLKERELFINAKRIKQYGLMLREQHVEIESVNSICRGLEREFSSKLTEAISKWRVPSRITPPKGRRRRLLFRDFFLSCKNSWDQRKVILLCDQLCVPMLEQAERLFGADSPRFYTVMLKLLKATIAIPNSKNRLLIPMAVCLSLSRRHQNFITGRNISTTGRTKKRGASTRQQILDILSQKVEQRQDETATDRNLANASLDCLPDTDATYDYHCLRLPSPLLFPAVVHATNDVSPAPHQMPPAPLLPASLPWSCYSDRDLTSVHRDEHALPMRESATDEKQSCDCVHTQTPALAVQCGVPQTYAPPSVYYSNTTYDSHAPPNTVNVCGYPNHEEVPPSYSNAVDSNNNHNMRMMAQPPPLASPTGCLCGCDGRVYL